MMMEETADQYLAPSQVSPAEFWGFDHVSVYTTLSLLATDGVHLSQMGKKIFVQELAGINGKALNGF